MRWYTGHDVALQGILSAINVAEEEPFKANIRRQKSGPGASGWLINFLSARTIRLTLLLTGVPSSRGGFSNSSFNEANCLGLRLAQSNIRVMGTDW